MPELLSPQQAAQTLVALPGPAAKPVPQGGTQAQPQAAPSPFRPMTGPGPRVLLLPHEDQPAGPARQARADAVRLERQIRPEHMARGRHVGDQESFFRAMHVDPYDDAPRLIYADWLEERGQPALAEMLRRATAAHRAAPIHPDDFTASPSGQVFGWANVAPLPHDRGGKWTPTLYTQVSTRRTTPGRANFLISLQARRPHWRGTDHPLHPFLHTQDADLVGRLVRESLSHVPTVDGMEHRPRFLESIRGFLPSDHNPERFAAQAPPGGLIVRGLMVKGGQFAPKEAVESHPAPTSAAPRRPPARDRLRAALRSRRQAP